MTPTRDARPKLLALLERVRADERESTLPAFAHADAVDLGTRALTLAVERSLPVAIRVTRGDQLAFHAATDGTSADNDAWIERKIRLVRRLEISSLQARVRHELDDGDLGWLDPVHYALAGGCIPLRMAGGALVGTLTVSGLPDVQDHDLAMEAVRAHLAG